MKRTRIKICGLTRPDDVHAAVQAGADALGFVFYANSPRAVSAAQACVLMSAVPPFVSTVALFVNAAPEEVAAVAAQAPFAVSYTHLRAHET